MCHVSGPIRYHWDAMAVDRMALVRNALRRAPSGRDGLVPLSKVMTSFEFSGAGDVHMPLNSRPIFRPAEAPSSSADIAGSGKGYGSPPRATKPAFDPKLIEDELAKPVPLVPDHKREEISAAAAASDKGGEERVRLYHEKRFMSAFAERLGTLRQLVCDIRSNYDAVTAMEAQVASIAELTPVYLDETTDAKQWTWPARLAVGSLLLFSFLLIFVGLNTNALVLMNSGISGFENPIRAYLFSLVSPAIAVGLKFLPALLSQSRGLPRLRDLDWGIGLVLSVLWALFFALTFPGMTTDPMALATSLPLGSVPASTASQGAWWLVLAGILAEAFLAVGCWVYGRVNRRPLSIVHPDGEPSTCQGDGRSHRCHRLQDCNR